MTAKGNHHLTYILPHSHKMNGLTQQLTSKRHVRIHTQRTCGELGQ